MDGSLRELADGEIVFRQNEPSDFACLVETGFVDVLDDAAGTDAVIATLGPGELLGEMGVIDGRPRSATARANGPTTVREIDAKDFLQRIETDSAFASSIMTVLVARLRRTTMGGGSDTPSPRIALPNAPDPTDPVVGPDDQSGPQRGTAAPAAPKGDAAQDSGPSSAPEPPSKSDRAGEQPPRSDDVPKAASAAPKPTVRPGPLGGNLPRVLVAPVTGDTEGTQTQSLLAWLEDADSFVALPLGDDRIGNSDLTDAARIDLLRRAIAEAGASVALHAEPSEDMPPRWLAMSVISPWPDEEARLGGFSVHDRIYVPINPGDGALSYLRGAIRAAIPGRAQGLKDALVRDLPTDLARARSGKILIEDLLPPEAAGRQLMSYGNAAARVGALQDGSIGLNDAVEAYRAALNTLPENDRLGRGLALLHLALTLNTIADRDTSDRARQQARDAVAEAAKLFDPKAHIHQYLTANARHGAILYRMALANGDLDQCKAGVEAFNRALAVCDKTTMAEPWADTMNGLGQMLILLGRLARNTEFLTWASQVCKNAMEVRTEQRNPLGWARTQNNRATALYLLGRAERNAAFLKQAQKGFADALRVFERFRANALIDTAKRNAKQVDTVLTRIDSGRTEEDREWWAA